MAAVLSVQGVVVEVSLSLLRPWAKNPRRIRAARLEDLMRTLLDDREMLWARALIVRPDGTVICGNQRFAAAVALGWVSIPVLVVDISDERAMMWALRDNSSWGEWDESLLAEIVHELVEGGLDLALSGFESRDIDRILALVRAEADPDELPPLPKGPPRSKPGELYRLGPHWLLCGDMTAPRAIDRALGSGERPSLLLTDPPWGVAYKGKTREGLRIANDDADGQAEFLGAAFTAIAAALSPGAPCYVFAPAGRAGTAFRLALQAAGLRLAQELVWVKDSIVLGHSDYHYQHEPVLFAHKPGPGRPGRGRHAGTRWRGGNDQSSVLFADRPKRSAEHPTCKPVELLSRLISNLSRAGEVVLDPFAGSGSTLISCEQLGRRCVAVELDPRYCDVIRDRYEAFCDGR